MPVAARTKTLPYEARQVIVAEADGDAGRSLLTKTMHELPVTQGILSVVLEAAEQAGGYPVQRIDLVIGTLSSIVDDSVQFYFDALSAGTLAQGAQLNFRRVPATLTCWACSYQASVIAPLPDCCAACGSTNVLIQDGMEFYVEAIEVEEPNDACSYSEINPDK